MNIEAKLTRPELWSWLEQREDPFLEAKHGEGSSVIVKIPKDAEIDYLFGNDCYYGDSMAGEIACISADCMNANGKASIWREALCRIW